MNDRTLKIVESAVTTFARYGIAKTTMNDIAVSAGVARQTVYNSFATKNDILRAAVRLQNDKTFEELKADWAGADGLEEIIDIYFEHGPKTWFALLQKMPDLNQLLEGEHEALADEMVRVEAQWLALFLEVFESLEVKSKDPAFSVEDLADFLFVASKTLKYRVTDLDALTRRLAILKSAFLALVDQA